MLGCLSWSAYHLVTGLATSPTILYFAATLGVLGISTHVTITAHLSKLSPRPGSLLSLLACIEALAPLASAPAIAALYSASLASSWPGAVFLLTGTLAGANSAIFAGLFFAG